MSTDEIIGKVIKYLNKQADPKDKKGMEAYMLNQFKYFGVKKPKIENIIKEVHSIIKDEQFINWKLIFRLFENKERETIYIALDLINKSNSKLLKKDIDNIEKLILLNSWWDSVDLLASRQVGYLFYKFPELKDTYIDKWMKSGNMWLQRTCLLFQLKYKNNIDSKLIETLISKLKGIDEFFIQKAIGWILREYSKTNALWVAKYVTNHKLSALAHREALKVINKEG